MGTHPPVTGRHRWPPGDEAAQVVTGLYQAHALAMVRLALLMLGDRASAEDVVQDAFLGLFRRWHWLDDPDKAEAYLRSAVLNGCRDALRRRSRSSQRDSFAALDVVELPSAEATAMFSEDRRRILAALRLLPGRQREALVCRYFLELSEEETARAMGVTKGTVKSSTSRAIAALGRMLKDGRC